MIDDFYAMANNLTPEVVTNMQQMVELGKDPTGKKLSPEAIQICIEALIIWESNHKPVDQRSGYIHQQCKNKPTAPADTTQPIKIV